MIYCERFVEFLIDIEAQLPTRRFFNALMDDSHVVTAGLLSSLSNREEGHLFTEVELILFEMKVKRYELCHNKICFGAYANCNAHTILHFNLYHSLSKFTKWLHFS